MRRFGCQTLKSSFLRLRSKLLWTVALLLMMETMSMPVRHHVALQTYLSIYHFFSLLQKVLYLSSIIHLRFFSPVLSILFASLEIFPSIFSSLEISDLITWAKISHLESLRHMYQRHAFPTTINTAIRTCNASSRV